MYRHLSGRLFHIPMLGVVFLLAVLAGALYLDGRDYGLTVIFLVCAFLFYLGYGFLVIPRIYTRPAGRLVKGLQALAKGDTGVEWGAGYRGELLDLRVALESLIGSLRTERASGDSCAGHTAPVAFYESLGSQLSEAARAVSAALESVTAGRGETKAKGLPASDEALRVTRHLARVAENIREISILERIGARPHEDVLLCELMREIETEAVSLACNDAAAVITACDESLLKRPMYTDRACLKGMIMALVGEGIAACGEGTVTVLASLQKRERDDFLEVCVAHTMRQLDADGGERKFSEALPLHHESSALCLARKSCTLLGGALEFEQTPGKSSVVTILVPARVRLPE